MSDNNNNLLVAVVAIVAIIFLGSSFGQGITGDYRHVPVTYPTCIDTDKGIDVYTPGSLIYGDIVKYDSCNTLNSYITEHYCFSGVPEAQGIKCDRGCGFENGIAYCLKEGPLLDPINLS